MFFWGLLGVVFIFELCLRLASYPNLTAIYQLNRLKYCPKQYLPPSLNYSVTYYKGFDKTLGKGYSCVQTFNQYGLRGEIPQKSEKKRFVLLGGSFVAGTGLPDGSTLCDVLAKQYPSYQFINCGIVASKVSDHLSFAIHVLPHLQADYLLYFPGIQFIHLAASSAYDQVEKGFPMSVVAKKVFLSNFYIYRYFLSLTAMKANVILKLVNKQLVSEITANYNRANEVHELPNEKIFILKRNQEAAVQKIALLIKICNHMNIAPFIIHAHSAYTNLMDQRLPLMHHRLSETIKGSPALIRSIEDTFGAKLEVEAKKLETPFFVLNPPKTSEFYYDDVHLNQQGVGFCGTQLGKDIIEKCV
jgi:hypothetical protein